MARRSASNPRYRRDAELGKTRKSAARAKPMREKGTVEVTRTAAKKKADAKPEVKGWRKFFQPLPTPNTPEFRRWRKIWAGLMITGTVFFLGALWQFRTEIGNWMLALTYTCLFTAIYIDWTKLRPMRKAMMAGGKGSSKGAPAAKAKEDKGDSAGDSSAKKG
ncbi:MAG: hypothetical protein Q8K99_14015 [Actinomycetota bacterium]|nr:hypothetical protein [Actinomycetota bacterium]